MSRDTRAMALPETSRILHIILLAGAIGAFMLLRAVSAHADDQAVPWECSAYSGDAQTRCMTAFAEIQREEISQLKGKLQVQESEIQQLKQQADRQAAALQRQLSASPTIIPSNPYVYSYIYPPAVGLGLYLGRPWIYGSPYHYRPYWGTRLYGSWRHHR